MIHDPNRGRTRSVVRAPALRTRLLLLVLLALLPAAGLMLRTAADQRRLAAARVRGDVLRLAQTSAGNQFRLFDGTRQLLIALAQLPQVRDQDGEACSSLFGRLLVEYPLYANLGVAGRDGEIFCSAVPSSAPVSVAERSWYLQAISDLGFAGGEYQAGSPGVRPTLGFGYPVLETAGAVKAVVFAQLDAGRLGEVATQPALAEEAAVTVIDARGTVLAADPQPERWVGRSFPRSALVRAVFSGIEGITEVAGLDGVSRIYAYTWVGLSPTTGMRVAVGIPKEQAFAAISRSFNRSLVGLGIVAALVLFATRMVANRTILQRVKALVAAARRVGEGDLSARSGPPYGTGELGELAHAFDEMTQTLQARHVSALVAESRRRAADARFERIVDSASDAIMAVDVNQEIILFNRAAERIFGYQAEAIRGRRLDFLLPSYHLDEDRRLDEEREPPVPSGSNDRDPGSSEPRKVQARRKDWNIFPAEVSVSRLSEDPRITHTIILRDVTERVTAQARLEASLRALRRTNEERKRLLDRLVKAQEEERKRIAADVHDDSIQAMVAASMRMALLRRSVTDPAQLARCQEVEETIRLAIVRLRNLVFQLRPPMLDQQGLAGALEAFLEQIAVTAGFSHEVQSHLLAEPPSQVRLVLYLIAQEALVNISKHARATRVVVVAEDREEGFYLRIQDDGVGFSLEETAEPVPGHLGLSSMRERAEMLGGWWRVRSIPGDGTTVECWVPVEG